MKRTGRPASAGFADRKRVAFEKLCEAAKRGLPCPSNRILGEPRAVMVLVHDGLIITQIFPFNRRMITILTGKHAGKSTARPAGDPWKTYEGGMITTARPRLTNHQPKARGRPSQPGRIVDPELAAATVRELVGSQ